jgi:hypothetical protein
LLGKRKLGSAIGALALIGGFMGAAGVSALTATSAGAAAPDPGVTTPNPGYSCTALDQTDGSTVTGNNLSLPASVPSGTLNIASPNDVIEVTCDDLIPNEGVAVLQASELEGLDPSSNQENFADISDGDTGAAADGSGHLDVTSPDAADDSGDFATYSNLDPNVTCPVNQQSANLGATNCIITAADIGTEDPLVIFDTHYTGSQPGVTGDATPQNPVISSPTPVILNPSAATPITINTTSGFWWGASGEGTGGSSPFPNPTVTISNPANPANVQVLPPADSTLTVSPAAYTYKKTTGGTATYPVMTGGVTVPASVTSALTPGTNNLTVIEGTEAGTQLSASFTVFVPGGSASAGTAPSGTVGPGTAVTWNGSTGWYSGSGSTFAGTWVSSDAACNTALAADEPITAHLTESGTGGTEAFTANTGDLPSAAFANTDCLSADAWSIDVTQTVGAVQVGSATLAPITLVSTASSCVIGQPGTNGYVNLYPGTPNGDAQEYNSGTPALGEPAIPATGIGGSENACLVQQTLTQVVNGTDLTVTEYQASQGINTGVAGDDVTDVVLTPVTLGPGVFQAGQGQLNTVEVNDSRGTLSGWTVTGILENDFQGPAVGNDHTIPADYLTWDPSVSLTYPGDLSQSSAVVPSGVLAPPPYGPDAGPAGSASGGNNSNIKWPSGVNDQEGTANAADGGTWPDAEGPSGLLNEVQAGPIANLGTANGGAADYQAEEADVLCQAAPDGGGGAFNCDATLSLAVPPYVAAGTYTDTLDLLTTAT